MTRREVRTVRIDDPNDLKSKIGDLIQDQERIWRIIKRHGNGIVDIRHVGAITNHVIEQVISSEAD